MFVVSKRNIILRGPNGEQFYLPRDYMGPVPDWAEGSAYLKALAEDGKVIISESGTDKDFNKREKKPKKAKAPEKDLEKEPEKEPSEGSSDGEHQEEEP